MSYFKAKMHQIRFRLGLRPRPRWGSLQCSPRSIAGFKRPTCKGRYGRRWVGLERDGKRGDENGRREERGREENGREGRLRVLPPSQTSCRPYGSK